MNNKIKGRIERSGLKNLAKGFFHDFDSSFIQFLRKKGKSALFGIKNEKGNFTVVGEEAIYFDHPTLGTDEIEIGKFLKILDENATQLGKNGAFEYLDVGNGNSIWLINVGVMTSIWNIIMLIDKLGATQNQNDKNGEIENERSEY